tara:strand:+ start:179 stop:835 length:657 start_codon:yes stop_codon:yes gene_type:complete
MNYQAARYNMVEQQVRPWDVLDNRVLEALYQIPKELFVPQKFKDLAFADVILPVGKHNFILPTKQIARMLQELSLSTAHRVLEIGTGSGYTTALLAKLAGEVVTVDYYKKNLNISEEILISELKFKNINFVFSDPLLGSEDLAPFDAIIINGSIERIPQRLSQQLAIGGSLIAIIGEAPVMRATKFSRLNQESWSQVNLFETFAPPLSNDYAQKNFKF